MTVYYVNSATGSNQQQWSERDSRLLRRSPRWKHLKLKPGDSVLLAAGSVFNEQFDLKYSGSVSAPITIGSYGAGDAPVIHSSGDGIHSLYASNIVIENIKISDTGGAAIYGGNVSNWTVRNVEVDNTGLSGKAGSVTFRTGQNITIENSTISDVNGDGVWIEKVNGVNLLNNTVTNAHGTDGRCHPDERQQQHPDQRQLSRPDGCRYSEGRHRARPAGECRGRGQHAGWRRLRDERAGRHEHRHPRQRYLGIWRLQLVLRHRSRRPGQHEGLRYLGQLHP